jgi:hypothetical protein
VDEETFNFIAKSYQPGNIRVGIETGNLNDSINEGTLPNSFEGLIRDLVISRLLVFGNFF